MEKVYRTPRFEVACGSFRGAARNRCALTDVGYVRVQHGQFAAFLELFVFAICRFAGNFGLGVLGQWLGAHPSPLNAFQCRAAWLQRRR